MSEDRDETGMEYRDSNNGPHFTTVAEIEASDLFEDESINWKYCRCHATFSHKEACEFIIHSGDPEFVENTVDEMVSFGCTKDFIESYKLAAASGAVRVLFWS
jgi:hypothetical protein